MKPVAFTYKANHEETERAINCLNILGTEFCLYNIPQFKPEGHLENDQVCFTFGDVASMAVETFIKDKKLRVRLVKLPAIKNLAPTKQNTQERLRVKQIMEVEGELIAQGIVQSEVTQTSKMTEEDMPSLNAEQMLSIKKIADQKKQKTFYQTAKNGKIILVGSEAPPENIACDIFIGFEELYTIRQVMDVLKVSEVNVVKLS